MSANQVEAVGAHIADFVSFMRRYLEDRSDVGVREFFDSIPDAVVIVDGLGCIAFVNSRVLPVFGYDQAELIGSPIETLLPDDLRERHLRLRNRYLEQDRQPRMMGQILTC